MSFTFGNEQLQCPRRRRVVQMSKAEWIQALQQQVNEKRDKKTIDSRTEEPTKLPPITTRTKVGKDNPTTQAEITSTETEMPQVEPVQEHRPEEPLVPETTIADPVGADPKEATKPVKASNKREKTPRKTASSSNQDEGQSRICQARTPQKKPQGKKDKPARKSTNSTSNQKKIEAVERQNTDLKLQLMEQNQLIAELRRSVNLKKSIKKFPKLQVQELRHQKQKPATKSTKTTPTLNKRLSPLPPQQDTRASAATTIPQEPTSASVDEETRPDKEDEKQEDARVSSPVAKESREFKEVETFSTASVAQAPTAVEDENEKSEQVVHVEEEADSGAREEEMKTSSEFELPREDSCQATSEFILMENGLSSTSEFVVAPRENLSSDELASSTNFIQID